MALPLNAWHISHAFLLRVLMKVHRAHDQPCAEEEDDAGDDDEDEEEDEEEDGVALAVSSTSCVLTFAFT